MADLSWLRRECALCVRTSKFDAAQVRSARYGKYLFRKVLLKRRLAYLINIAHTGIAKDIRLCATLVKKTLFARAAVA